MVIGHGNIRGQSHGSTPNAEQQHAPLKQRNVGIHHPGIDKTL
jgi:hypothetical protein